MSRLALVTGGARGIGAAICRRLAQDGMRVAVTDIRGEHAADVCASLPGQAHGSWYMDVVDERSVDDTFSAIENQHGPVSVLVCNAGILILHDGARLPIAQTSLDEWERTQAVNARGTFLCARAFLRARTAAPVAHGRIVTFSSCAAQIGGYRSSAAYIASKSAILGLTKAMAREAAPLGITVNGIAPGLIDTDMMRLSMAPGQEQQVAANVPLGRLGHPGDVAAAVSFLVSEGACYVTGTMNDVNGGYRMQ
ncbi:MAG: SDR family oxidoreductase [Ramlibacter sp.]|nr:SDR family oxidoreductase [Ramlibacter sp.]